ncbi:hypothetical protein GFY24_23950 [Nocardia sp. SYP-A9097]|uniref:hypothetical protein n=1 Tax=Nocardia sp. SYP-A9097 TaxID=2663237 RepID=UPI00129A4032|nr:hypothetical protein [Nocardia sp. SYP-A9097]MRH90460.1 hypothetical protein [Nocardia sp. SYP-A9097]
MSQRQADGDKIARAAASAGVLAFIIVAKAGSRVLGWSFGLIMLFGVLTLALIGAGAYFWSKKQVQPAPPGIEADPPTQPLFYQR